MEQIAFVDVDEFDENNVNLSEPPRSAVHYLQQVALSRKRCPQVVKVTIDPNIINTPSSSDLHKETPVAINAPSRDWAYAKCDEFSWNRTLLQAKRDKFGKANIKFPSWRDMERWRLFCLGDRETEIEMSDATGEPMPSNQQSTGHPPSPVLILNLSQIEVNSLIQFLIQIFSDEGYSKTLFQWMYSVLLVVEKPLLHDVCAALRSFTKQCREMRSTLVDQHETAHDEPSPNEFSLFIALVSIYYEQKDLADHK